MRHASDLNWKYQPHEHAWRRSIPCTWNRTEAETQSLSWEASSVGTPNLVAALCQVVERGRAHAADAGDDDIVPARRILMMFVERLLSSVAVCTHGAMNVFV